MPIEIRELVVRARVDPEGGGARSSGRSGDAGGRAAGRDTVEACVREVLRILEEKRER